MVKHTETSSTPSSIEDAWIDDLDHQGQSVRVIVSKPEFLPLLGDIDLSIFRNRRAKGGQNLLG